MVFLETRYQNTQLGYFSVPAFPRASKGATSKQLKLVCMYLGCKLRRGSVPRLGPPRHLLSPNSAPAFTTKYPSKSRHHNRTRRTKKKRKETKKKKQTNQKIISDPSNHENFTPVQRSLEDLGDAAISTPRWHPRNWGASWLLGASRNEDRVLLARAGCRACARPASSRRNMWEQAPESRSRARAHTFDSITLCTPGCVRRLCAVLNSCNRTAGGF